MQKLRLTLVEDSHLDKRSKLLKFIYLYEPTLNISNTLQYVVNFSLKNENGLFEVFLIKAKFELKMESIKKIDEFVYITFK